MLIPSLPGAEGKLARTEIGWRDLDYWAQGPALAWSADGRFLFTVETTGATGARGWVCDADGSNPLKLTSFDSGYSGTPRWSPDGRSIAFDDSSAGNWEIYVVSALGGKAVRLTDNPALDAAPSWSHDANWVYFGSNRSGRFEIWKVRADGKNPVQMTENGGFEAFEPDDGSYLCYTKTDGGSALWKRRVEGGAERPVVESVFSRNFALTKRCIYFMQDAGSGIEFKAIDMAGGKVTMLARLGRFLNLGLTVSPDERWALYSQADAVGSDLMLVEGFR